MELREFVIGGCAKALGGRILRGGQERLMPPPSPHYILCPFQFSVCGAGRTYRVLTVIRCSLRKSAFLGVKLFQQIMKPRFRAHLRHSLSFSWLGRHVGGLDISSVHSWHLRWVQSHWD